MGVIFFIRVVLGTMILAYQHLLLMKIHCLNRKIPGGVFGRDGEMHLFAAVELPDEEQVNEIRR